MKRFELINISKEEFNREKAPFISQIGSPFRCFGLITDGEKSFKMAWQSDKIKPWVKEIGPNICGVGIDQNFSIVDFNSGLIRLKLSLTYNFYTVYIFLGSIFVITELEILKLDGTTFEVIVEYGLPDFFEGIEIEGDHLKVMCKDGLSVIVT